MARMIEFTKDTPINGVTYPKGATVSVSDTLYVQLTDSGEGKAPKKTKSQK